MKIYEMADLLYSKGEQLPDEGEILVEQDGILYDFDIEDTEEIFDGFDTVYPAGLKIVLKPSNHTDYENFI